MKVLLAVSDPNIKMTLRELLVPRGIIISAEAGNASEALRRCRCLPVDLVIMDAEIEGGRAGQVAIILEEDAVAPVLMLATNRDPGIRDFAYIMKPVTAANLIPAIDSTLFNYRKRLSLLKEVDRLRNQIATRRSIDMAKGVLMRHHHMSEEQAHRFLQKTSMDKGIPLKEVADAVVAFNKNIKGECEL